MSSIACYDEPRDNYIHTNLVSYRGDHQGLAVIRCKKKNSIDNLQSNDMLLKQKISKEKIRERNGRFKKRDSFVRYLPRHAE